MSFGVYRNHPHVLQKVRSFCFSKLQQNKNSVIRRRFDHTQKLGYEPRILRHTLLVDNGSHIQLTKIPFNQSKYHHFSTSATSLGHCSGQVWSSFAGWTVWRLTKNLVLFQSCEAYWDWLCNEVASKFAATIRENLLNPLRLEKTKARHWESSHSSNPFPWTFFLKSRWTAEVGYPRVALVARQMGLSKNWAQTNRYGFLIGCWVPIFRIYPEKPPPQVPHTQKVSNFVQTSSILKTYKLHLGVTQNREPQHPMVTHVLSSFSPPLRWPKWPSVGFFGTFSSARAHRSVSACVVRKTSRATCGYGWWNLRAVGTQTVIERDKSRVCLLKMFRDARRVRDDMAFQKASRAFHWLLAFQKSARWLWVGSFNSVTTVSPKLKIRLHPFLSKYHHLFQLGGHDMYCTLCA